MTAFGADPDHDPAPQAPEKPKPSKVTWLTPFFEVWQGQFPGSLPAMGAWAKNLKPMVERHGEPEVLDRWRVFLERTPPEYATCPAFVRGWTSFAAGATVPVRPKSWVDDLDAVAGRMIDAATAHEQAALAGGTR